jgi:hypothetical protein
LKKILEEYFFYEGILNNFCSENNITKHQLYYYKKKFKKQSKSVFHVISSAVIYSVVETAKANGLIVEKHLVYLMYVL